MQKATDAVAGTGARSSNGRPFEKAIPPKSTLSRILDQNEQIPGPWKQLFKNHFKAIFWTNQQQQKKELQDLLPNELKQKKN